MELGDKASKGGEEPCSSRRGHSLVMNVEKSRAGFSKARRATLLVAKSLSRQPRAPRYIEVRLVGRFFRETPNAHARNTPEKEKTQLLSTKRKQNRRVPVWSIHMKMPVHPFLQFAVPLRHSPSFHKTTRKQRETRTTRWETLYVSALTNDTNHNDEDHDIPWTFSRL